MICGSVTSPTGEWEGSGYHLVLLQLGQRRQWEKHLFLWAVGCHSQGLLCTQNNDGVSGWGPYGSVLGEGLQVLLWLQRLSLKWWNRETGYWMGILGREKAVEYALEPHAMEHIQEIPPDHILGSQPSALLWKGLIPAPVPLPVVACLEFSASLSSQRVFPLLLPIQNVPVCPVCGSLLSALAEPGLPWHLVCRVRVFAPLVF